MKKVMVYLSDEDYVVLRQMAFDTKVSMSKILSHAIGDGFKETKKDMPIESDGSSVTVKDHVSPEKTKETINAIREWRVGPCPKHEQLPKQGKWVCCGE